jgi:hypothetical protein
MRRAFFLIAIILFCFKAPCQSLTLNELTDSLNRADNTKYLISKNFKLVLWVADEFEFKKNDNQTNEERVSSAKGWHMYITKDVNYVKTLLKQASIKFKKRSIKSIRNANKDGRIKAPWEEFTTGKSGISFALYADSAVVLVDFKRP